VADWVVTHPVVVGIGTFLLMWSDWVLTVLQERERKAHYSAHYRSYPVDTIEGHPGLRQAVRRARLVDPRHLVPAAVLAPTVAYALTWMPPFMKPAFLGFVWGLFLVVDTAHAGNLLGYRASRRGLHGRIWLHLRTGYLVQMGRYLALAALLVVLALLSASPFVGGVAGAGAVSALRQLLWRRRVPAIPSDDAPPAESSAEAEHAPERHSDDPL